MVFPAMFEHGDLSHVKACCPIALPRPHCCDAADAHVAVGPVAHAPPQAAAQLLAAREWGPLYDAAALAANTVPVACCAYFEVSNGGADEPR